MDRVTGKYMRKGDGDGEGKARPHPASLPCLELTHVRVPGTLTFFDIQ